MSGDKTKLVPKLRFPEFRGAGGWEPTTLGEKSSILKGKGISKADLDQNGSLACIRYGELYTRYGEIIREAASRTKVSISELFLSKPGDVIIPSSGETKIDIAKASCVLAGGIALGGDLNVIRSKLNGIFLSYYLNGPKRLDIAKVAQGDTVAHLYPHQLEALHIAIPSPAEQQKIADCLSSLDELIASQARKVDALKTHKKGLMQQLFPREGETHPRLRFPEFQNAWEWERRKLGSLFVIGSGRDYKHLALGNIPVYGSGGYMLSVNDFLHDGESVCIGRKGTIDRPMFLSGKFWTVDTLFFTHSFNDCIPKFMLSIFENIEWRKHNEAGGVPSLSKTIIEKIETAIPSIPEQQRIADCLTSLDALITAATQELETVKTHKKGLMQQIFPAAATELI